MRKHATIPKVRILFFLAVILMLAPRGLLAAQSCSKTYFSNGQAAFDPQNQAKSRQQALKAFLTRGLVQAVAHYLSPDQMGSQFEKLQKELLAGPEKFIDKYQVFSEKQTDGQFQVVGKVTVSMTALKEELQKQGFLAAPEGATASRPPEAPPSAGANPAETSPAPAAAKNQTAQPEKPLAASTTPATSEATGPNGPGQLSRGISPTKKDVLWAVVEKWDEKWVLPTNGGDIRCIFARSIAKQMDGFGFSILLPQPGSVEMDTDGNIPPYQAVAIAGKLGIKDVVVGKISYIVHRKTREVSLHADLRVPGPGQDQAGVEIHKTLSMEDLSNQAGALELARRIAPRLNELLGGPESPADKSAPGSAELAPHPGHLLIHLSSLQYSHWTELEKILHTRFEAMHVDDLQIGPAQTTLNLSGVDGGYLLKLNQTKLPSGVEIRIDSYSTRPDVMKISFVSPAKLQAETK